MISRSKRLPTNTADAAIRAMENAAKPPPELPKHLKLRPLERPFWNSIMESRLRDEWSDTDLVVAAQLARCQADIEVQHEKLANEGFVLESAKEEGNVYPNPRAAIVETLIRREQALLRTLHLGSQGRDMDGARRLQRQGTALRKEVATESRGLLAT